jgi:hypothetical protein
VKDGRLFGRGAADMKGGLAAILYAARPVSERGTRVYVVVPDEETAGRLGSVRLSRLGLLDASAVGAIVAEPTWGPSGTPVSATCPPSVWVLVLSPGAGLFGLPFGGPFEQEVVVGRDERVRRHHRVGVVDGAVLAREGDPAGPLS